MEDNLATIAIALFVFLGWISVYLVFWADSLPRREAVKKGKTYFLDTACSKLGFMPKITCLVCNKTSYHPQDVKNKYCGNCHIFHEEIINELG